MNLDVIAPCDRVIIFVYLETPKKENKCFYYLMDLYRATGQFFISVPKNHKCLSFIDEMLRSNDYDNYLIVKEILNATK